MNVKRFWYHHRRKAPSTTAANATTKKKIATNSNTNKWRSYLDKNSYKVYYYNIDTKVVQWEKPNELEGGKDDYSAASTASTTSIATVEDEDGIPSVTEDNMIIIKSSSKADTNSTTYSAEKIREHMISSMIALQKLVHNSTETITKSSKVILSNIQQNVPSPPTSTLLCASDELDTDSDRKREEMTVYLLGDDASLVSPTENTSNDVDNTVVDDSGCNVLPSIFTCKLDDETANQIVLSKAADEIVPKSNNITLESALHYDIKHAIIQKTIYNDIDQTKSLLQSLSSDYRDTMDEYSYHAVVSKMNMLREQQQKEQIQDSSIQNGKTLDSLLELVHTDDTISCDSSLDESDVSDEIEEVEEGEDEGLLNAVQVFAKYLQHGLVTEGSDRYPYSSTV